MILIMKATKMLDIKTFPQNLREKIWLRCDGRDIFKLLLVNKDIEKSILKSSWWRQALERKVGHIKQYPGLDWPELYLTYLHGWEESSGEPYQIDTFRLQNLSSIPGSVEVISSRVSTMEDVKVLHALTDGYCNLKRLY
jgi:hypothetical protein